MSARVRCRSILHLGALGVGVLLSVGALPVFAQQMDHSKMQMPAAAPAPAPAPQREAEKAPAKKAAPRQAAPPPTAGAAGNDAHAGHAMSAPDPSLAQRGHQRHQRGQIPLIQRDLTPLMPLARAYEMPVPSSTPHEPIPVLTDADRAAAFPDVAGHGAHDKAIHSYWLVDRLEAWDADEGTGVGWEALGWIGTDLDRLWLRSEGERSGGSTESADIEALYGRNIARWWDAVVGVRQDFGEGPSQTFLAFGVMGLAPYKFEVEATAYIGQSGQTALRLEAEYDTLLTNRLILQWLAEAELHGRNDESRGIGSGLGTFEAGLRLRYEITRKFAPYIGVVWERAFGNTADFRRADGEDIHDTRIVAGVRFWF